MSESLPTIQGELSRTQREFLDRVERHVDAPESVDESFEAEAVYRLPDEELLPGAAVRFRLVIDDQGDEDLTERRHEVEFLDHQDGAPVARLRHRMKRVEASAGRHFWTESRIEVDAPDVPGEQAPQHRVEDELDVYLGLLRTFEDELEPAACV